MSLNRTQSLVLHVVEDFGISLRELYVAHVYDAEIAKCLSHKIFFAPSVIYNTTDTWNDISGFSLSTIELVFIATIVNEIQNKTYDYNFPLGEGKISQAIDNLHFRAFQYCVLNFGLLKQSTDSETVDDEETRIVNLLKYNAPSEGEGIKKSLLGILYRKVYNSDDFKTAFKTALKNGRIKTSGDLGNITVHLVRIW